MKKTLITMATAVAITLALSPGSVSASGDVEQLPPPGPPPAVVPPPQQLPPPQQAPPPGVLPRTGTGIQEPLAVGLMALIAGGGLVIVAQQRRRDQSA